MFRDRVSGVADEGDGPMIDIQDHIRNRGALNLFDGRSVAPESVSLCEESLQHAIDQIKLMTRLQREVMFITGAGGDHGP